MSTEYYVRRIDDSSYGEPVYRVSWYDADTDTKVQATVCFGDSDDAGFREAIRAVTGIPEGHLTVDHELSESSTVQRWYTYEERWG